jgi:hypothetical protein
VTAPRDLDVYDVAHLAGGLPRMVEAALVGLVETGSVAVHTDGALEVVDPGRRHPVEGAVLDAIGGRGRRSVETVRWRVAADPRVLAAVARLRAADLVRPAVLHRGRRPLVPTAAGRRELRRRREPLPDDAVLRVALDGPVAVGDVTLRSALGDRRRVGHPVHPDLDFADGRPAAERTRARIRARVSDLWPGA